MGKVSDTGCMVSFPPGLFVVKLKAPPLLKMAWLEHSWAAVPEGSGTATDGEVCRTPPRAMPCWCWVLLWCCCWWWWWWWWWDLEDEEWRWRWLVLPGLSDKKKKKEKENKIVDKHNKENYKCILKIHSLRGCQHHTDDSVSLFVFHVVHLPFFFLAIWLVHWDILLSSPPFFFPLSLPSDCQVLTYHNKSNCPYVFNYVF